MRKDPDEAVSALIPALNDLRRNWFDQVMTRYSGTYSIVNSEFSREIDLGVPEDELPSSFPFNRFDGEAAEALIVNWQAQVAMNFSRQHSYFAEEEFGDFVGMLMKYGKMTLYG